MGRQVAVIGAGVAGLTAAHELAERGFVVDVYEAREVPGGRARSLEAAETGVAGRPDLPGEHDVQRFPGFFRHVTDTMARIPLAEGRGSVLDHLVRAPDLELGGMGLEPFIAPSGFPRGADEWALLLLHSPAAYRAASSEELRHFLRRLFVLLTSCDERRTAEYEHVSWWDFVGAEHRSESYRQHVARGLSQVLAAAPPQRASARSVGGALLQRVLNACAPGGAGDRVLDGPTRETWIDPWVRHLRRQGVRFHFGTRCEALCVAGRRLTGAVLRGDDGVAREATADHYVVAVPAEAFARLLDPALLEADPALGWVRYLRSDWRTGVQFYLRKELALVHGHGIYPDTPWALTAVDQGSFWRRGPRHYGTGEVRTILSVTVSDSHTPGVLYGRSARQARSAEEIGDEVWAQLKACVNHRRPVLCDEDVVGRHVDPALTFGPYGVAHNAEPVLIPTTGAWDYRPEAATAIENLFLAGGYVRTHADLATTEGANEAARRAVNALLAASDVGAARCELFPREEPAVLAPARALDRVRFRAGHAHLLEEPRARARVAARDAAAPVLDAVRGAPAARAKPARRGDGPTVPLAAVG